MINALMTPSCFTSGSRLETLTAPDVTHFRCYLQFAGCHCSNTMSRSQQTGTSPLPLSSILLYVTSISSLIGTKTLREPIRRLAITSISLVAKVSSCTVVSVCTTCSQSCSLQHLPCNPNQPADAPLHAHQHPSNCQGTGEFPQPSFFKLSAWQFKGSWLDP